MKKKILTILISILALCTCMFTFTACGENEPPHTHSYNQQVINDTFKASDATCEEKAKYYYSCTCGGKSTEVFEHGEELGHSFTNYEYNEDAKCEVDGTETAVCGHGCGESDTRTKVGSALEHEYGAWVTNDNGTHTRTCAHDNTHKETKNCNGGTATCQAKAVCVDCGAEYGSIAGHIAKEVWITTEKYHYHECKTQGCTEKLDKENHTFDKNKKCTVCEYVTTEPLWTEISSDVFAIDGTNLYVKVPNTQSSFAFAETINVAEGATYKVYTDIQCKEESNIPSYMVNNLVVGDNTYYFLVSNEGSFPKIYTVTVRRRPMHTVNFVTNGGTAVANQTVEEDFYATEPIITRDGYTFDGWDYDFSAPITKNITITASWTANKDTKYKVEYYLQNIEDDNYTLDNTRSFETVGTTDTTASVTPETIEHFTYNANKSNISGNIDGKGTLVLKVYYTRNIYTLSINDTSAGSITNVGSYKYGIKPFVSSATKSNLGYDVVWYNGETLLSNDLNYTFTATQNVTAKFVVKEEMANFNFTSTTTSCEITGIKDKTVTEITVPDYVTSISQGAFSDCSSLTSITLPFVGAKKSGTNNTHFGYIFGASSYSYNEDYVPTSLKTVIITGGTSIGNYAFEDCSKLTSVTIGNGVTSIGSGAFSGCRSLTYNVKNNLKYLGNSTNPYLYLADTVNTSITTANIDNNCKIIGSYAFSYCSSLEAIEIPNSVEVLGNYAFYKCSSLTSVVIPNSVTSIGSSAFSYCSSLTSIEIPNSVTTIGGWAFEDCSKLTSVTIGNGVTSIGDYAFNKCSSLTSIEIPNSVTTIGDGAFEDCSKLTSVTIGNGVTSICYSAFWGCSSLTSIKYRGTQSQWLAISKASNWNYGTGSYTIIYNYTGN